jgi:YHS domain-containing protein
MKKKYLVGLGLLILISFLLLSNTNNEKISGNAIIDQVTIIENKYVCMVNDDVYDTPQIPVPIDGKTYYGCCMGCKAKLENDINTRYAIDPISNNKVDKATAIIGQTNSGKVLYFESQENFNKYNKN